MENISIKTIFLTLLVLSGSWFMLVLIQQLRKRLATNSIETESSIGLGLTGFVGNFMDTLGIGSFAIMTSSFKNFKLVEDKKIPGTLNAGVAIVCIAQAFIFIKAVPVDTTTLMSMIISALGGALLGARVVSKMKKKTIQLTMTIALAIMGITMVLGKMNVFPVGGDAMALEGWKLVVACIANFLFGALNTVGVGLFAPCMVTVYLLGLNPAATFPIMMGSTALLVPFAGIKFLKEDVVSMKGTLLINICGTIGVFVAAYLVKSLDLNLLQYLIIFVVAYTTWLMGKSYLLSSKKIH
ncbi:sulfite exporter TauE/SafE family protein [Flammeovirga kamogawensis]|uniref:Probable membrane transporter protein n=1 Tax=Flammeovirga kamogawensis TaxID=373891 RepID=A0ABX8H3W6_9BACT|nr:sulfite exporter TauE/SafE family protein [Flammeovirga kamogawensis]MBB6463623.1 putative membrane protein YfcA [Flammeovirga kamogawensis]QWG09845.1 sulfite exporter TauE/SafE family protein [Flammeovirga kamogawensis]TRX65352.1 sulfite exporter TauE/SafE family protein [Flammeovirga kamogawensis]